MNCLFHRRLFLRRLCVVGLVPVLLVCLLAAPADAVVKPDQSNLRVLGMPIVGPVHHSGSDERSAEFNRKILPGMMTLATTQLREGLEFKARGVTRLDEDKLYLMQQTDRPIRVYFITEHTGGRHSIGFSASLAGSPEKGARQLIFPDMSAGKYGKPYLLEPGDWVEVGSFDRGLQFEFFMVLNGPRGGRTIWTNEDHLNRDKLQHIAAWLLGDRYVLLAYDDAPGGGDRDFNDNVIVVDFSPDLGHAPQDLLPR